MDEFESDFHGTDVIDYDDDFGSGEVTQPPFWMIWVTLTSIVLAFVSSLAVLLLSNDHSLQTKVGIGGYVLSIIVPIVMLSLLNANHQRNLRDNYESYNTHGAYLAQSRMRLVVGIGFALAVLPITLAVLEKAQEMA